MAPLLGVSPDQFWNLTPFAFGLIMKAQNKKLHNDFDTIKYHAWHVAAFTRAKKMPSFKEFIKPLNDQPEKGINEAGIKAALKAYKHGYRSKSKREPNS